MGWRLILVVVAGLSLTSPAWAQMTIDGRTVETYERSIRAMADSLPQSERETFGLGLMNMIIWDYPASAGATGLSVMSLMTPALAAAHITLDGVTIDKIMDRGRAVVAQQQSAKGQQASSEDQTSILRTCLQNRMEMTDFQVVNDGTPPIELKVTVENGLSWSVSALAFYSIAKSPGRSAAWGENTLSTTIPGGIEPGEKKRLSISFYGLPPDLPPDANFSLSITDAADADKRPLIGGVYAS